MDGMTEASMNVVMFPRGKDVKPTMTGRQVIDAVKKDKQVAVAAANKAIEDLGLPLKPITGKRIGR